MLLDANVLLYSVDEDSPFHHRAVTWLTEALNGPHRVGIPWTSLWAFVRIASNPRASSSRPGSPSPARAVILRDLITRYDLRGNLVPDAALAAMCIEHGIAMVSADSDFARFPELTWINPLLPG